MIKFNFKTIEGNIYNGIEHDSRLKDIDWSKFFNNENFYIVTHNGQFHADDVFCVALTYILYVLSDRDNGNKLNMHEFMDVHLIRESSLDVAIAKHGYILDKNANTVVFDIAGGHYDHHCAKTDIPRVSYDDVVDTRISAHDVSRLYKGSEYDYAKDARNLCSFGQLWQHIGRGFNIEFTNLPEQSKGYAKLYHDLIDMSVYAKVFKEYALPISLVDLNGPKNWISYANRIISNCNRDSETFVGGFIAAFTMGANMLFGEINNVQNQCEVLNDVYGKLNTSKTKSGAYISEWSCGEKSYIVIPDGCDININLNTLEYIYTRISNEEVVSPLFIFNQNPSTRDGTYRIVFGSKVSLNKLYIETLNIKYKFCHEAGFMITFETVQDAQAFIDYMERDSNVLIG